MDRFFVPSLANENVFNLGLGAANPADQRHRLPAPAIGCEESEFKAAFGATAVQVNAAADSDLRGQQGRAAPARFRLVVRAHRRVRRP